MKQNKKWNKTNQRKKKTKKWNLKSKNITLIAKKRRKKKEKS